MANSLRQLIGGLILGKAEPAPLTGLDAARNSGWLAATTLPPAKPVKAPRGGGASVPGYRKTVDPSPAQIARQRFDVATVDLAATYRTATDTYAQARNLARVSPEAAASQAAHLRVGIPSGYIAIARDPDGEFSEDGTRLVLQILRRMERMADYENGFSQVGSLRSVSEALGRQMFQTGAMAMELVLDKSRLPLCFQPLPTTQLFLYEDGRGTKPVQRIGGQDIDLDIPTFFWVQLDADLLDAYAQSPMESAIQPILGSAQFLNDLRRLCARFVYKRFDISIDYEKLETMVPADYAGDQEATKVWWDSKLVEIQDTISNLGVEDALVHYDFFAVQYISGDDGDTPGTFDTVNGIFNNKVATALKTPPSVLGMGSKSASMANTETLMFMLNCDGMIRQKLQEIYSKALTLAVRLMGLDVTVDFEFDEIELRPKSELWAYRAMKMSYWRQQLSDGYITDAEYAVRTTGNLPRKGYAERVGTYFMDATAPGAESENPDSQTSNMSQDSNKAPAAPKGGASKKGTKQ